MTTTVRLVLIPLTLGLSFASSPAGQAPAPPPPALSPIEQEIAGIKNPAPWLSWGADVRVRNEYINDLVTHNPDSPMREQDVFRFRARIWSSVKPVTNLTLNARLAAEPRYWVKEAGYTVFRGNTGMDWTEGVIDNLNVQWKEILGQPVALGVGRQDILLGDGWLVGDGTPADGSWTYFLDSARLTFDLKAQRTTIDLIGILQYAEDDAWLPTINNQGRLFTDQDEKGAILYVSNKSIPEANVDAYFIYKNDDRLDSGAGTGDNADIYTLGARLTGALADHWKYMLEGAYQFGEKQDPRIQFPDDGFTGFRDLEAFGVQSKLTYAFKDRLNNQLGLSYEFLTGDDPDTRNDEMFDVLWGRWPHWAETAIYGWAAETRAGQLANLHRFGPFWTVTPIKDTDFSVLYNALFAPEDIATRGAPGLFSNDGNFRGHFVQAALKHKFSRHVSGHLWSELLFPGDYYVDKSMASFLRAEVMVSF